MFDLEQSIAHWRREMFLAGVQTPEALDELEGHLRDRIANLQTGLAEQDAFQTATKQLGESAILKREFAKSRQWFPRDNPMELNLLAAWFILGGFNIVLSATRIVLTMWSSSFISLSLRIALCIFAILSLQIVIGIGLLRRSNFWRYCALLAVVLNSFSDAYCIVTRLSTPSASAHGSYFVMMGLMVPMSVQWFTSLVDICVMIWGCWLLTRPSVRELFLSGKKTKTA